MLEYKSWSLRCRWVQESSYRSQLHQEDKRESSALGGDQGEVADKRDDLSRDVAGQER